jgi:ubiquinone/menaquinone biosynthesis C-methylase UbiE
MSALSSSGFRDIPVEKVQSYWDVRPCNIRHSTKPVGSEEYFHEVEFRKYRVEPHIPRFAEFERWKGKKVLEIGCGIGTDTINFARHGAQVTAVDLSEKSIEIARQRARVFGLEDKIRFYHGDAERLSEFLPQESYDLVYSFGVIHHTPHPDNVLAQITRYVKPGGAVKIMVYYRWSWKVFWILCGYGRFRFWSLPSLIAAFSEAQTGCPVTYTYSKRGARRWLAKHGFEVTKVQVNHIFRFRISDYVQHRYTVVWYFRWLPPTVFECLERLAGWHLCLTAQPR